MGRTRRLIRAAQLRLRGLLTTLLPSIAFGIQHMFFVSTLPVMVVLGSMFLVRGLGLALIFRVAG